MTIRKSVWRVIVRQFGRPSGALGRLAGLVMERRPSNRERNLQTLALLEIQPEDHVLEIGFGPGFALSRAAELAKRGRVLGVDHSEVMVERASRRNATAIAGGRMELRLGNAAEVALPEAAVDKAYAVNVFMFWGDPEAVLRRLLACLRPGGLLAITHQPRNPGATDDDARADAGRIVAALKGAGFVEVGVKVLPMKPVSAACVLARRPPGRRPSGGG